MQIRPHRSLACLALGAAILLAAPGPFTAPGWAEDVVLTSPKPYWTVGVRDPILSRACSLGRFNLLRTDKLVARFTGAEGADTLAIGKGSGTNIFDPEHLAKPAEDYYFRNQNTTSCEVYVGGRRKGASAPRPPG
jgi:hypothetical protein